MKVEKYVSRKFQGCVSLNLTRHATAYLNLIGRYYLRSRRANLFSGFYYAYSQSEKVF